MTTKELEQLLDRYGDSIYGFCLHLTGCKEQADDLYQDTFLKTIEIQQKIKLSNMEQDLLAAKNYIIGIAIRIWKKTLSKNKRTVQDVSLEEYLEYLVNLEDVALQTEKRELYFHLYKVVKGLPDKLRIVVSMYYSLEMSIRDIAETLHIPQGTVKSRLFIAREKIAEEMEELGYEI